MISLGGKPKWLPLKFGYHDVMRTSLIIFNAATRAQACSWSTKRLGDSEARIRTQSLSWLRSSVVRASNRQSEDPGSIPEGLSCVFSSDPAVSSSLFVREKKREFGRGAVLPEGNVPISWVYTKRQKVHTAGRSTFIIARHSCRRPPGFYSWTTLLSNLHSRPSRCCPRCCRMWPVCWWHRSIVHSHGLRHSGRRNAAGCEQHFQMSHWMAIADQCIENLCDGNNEEYATTSKAMYPPWDCNTVILQIFGVV